MAHSAGRQPPLISAIIPTIGRPASLRALVESLASQTLPVAEIIVADASGDPETKSVLADWRPRLSSTRVEHVTVAPPNAVRQRQAAIDISRGAYLLLLDDDVRLTATCVERLYAALTEQAGTVAATAMIRNIPWPRPTRAWRFYLRHWHHLDEGAWQGRVVGPLLRFGYHPAPLHNVEMEWLGVGNSLLTRDSFNQAGGFSSFFLHRCTTHEDVDLGLRLARVGRIVLAHDALLEHHHDPLGRVSVRESAEDDVYNRFMVMTCSQGRSRVSAGGLALLYVVLTAFGETVNLHRSRSVKRWIARLVGMMSGLTRAAMFGRCE